MNWTDDQLFDIALGNVDSDVAGRFQADLLADPDLSGRFAAISELVDAVAADLSEEPPPTDGRSRLLDAIENANRFAYLAPKVADLLGVAESTALTHLAGLDDPTAWGPGVLPGTTMVAVPTDREDVGIVWLKMPAGMEFPHHEHLGSEKVLVVQGRYIDHRGVLHPPGTVLTEDAESEHSFHIDADGPEFICLAVVQGGIRIGDADVTREALYGG